MDSEPVPAAATAASIEVTPGQPQPYNWLVAAAVLLGAILTILDGSIVNLALPYMQRSFGVGVDRISWVVTSYLAAVSVMIPLSGWTAVRIGRRRYLLGLGRAVRGRLGALRARPGHRPDGGVPRDPGRGGRSGSAHRLPTSTARSLLYRSAWPH
jgi:Major Facilitator Superfamily